MRTSRLVLLWLSRMATVCRIPSMRHRNHIPAKRALPQRGKERSDTTENVPNPRLLRAVAGACSWIFSRFIRLSSTRQEQTAQERGGYKIFNHNGSYNSGILSTTYLQSPSIRSVRAKTTSLLSCKQHVEALSEKSSQRLKRGPVEGLISRVWTETWKGLASVE